MHPEQVQALRAMTPGQRLEAAQRLYWSAPSLTEAGTRLRHPDWTDEQVQEEVKRVFQRARD